MVNTYAYTYINKGKGNGKTKGKTKEAFFAPVMEHDPQSKLLCEETMRRTMAANKVIIKEEITHKEIFSLVDLLKSCSKNRDIHRGVRIHTHIVANHLLPKNPYLASSLIYMYAKCGMLKKAHDLLEELLVRDIFSWSSLISGYTQQGRSHEALNCFDQMQCEGLAPNLVIFTCILKACGDGVIIEKGIHIHEEIISRGMLAKDVVLGTSLVDMYAKCGMITKAQEVFDELFVKNVVTWYALIAGYTQQGHSEEAFNCFERMRNEGIFPDDVIFNSVLKASGSEGWIQKGKSIHVEIMNRQEKKNLCVGKILLYKGMKLFDIGNNILLSTALVDMYAKCGELTEAREILQCLTDRDVVTWSALISGYAQHGEAQEALKCFERMHSEGISPNIITFISILNACGRSSALDKGKRIHGEVVNRGMLKADIVLANAFVDMYAKCGDFATAKQVLLKELPAESIVSWNALITGYVQQCQYHEALECFEHMKRNGISGNTVTFICILKACGIVGAISIGELIHDEIMDRGWIKKDIVLGTALVDMYAKCGKLTKANKVFDELVIRDEVSWSALIAGYAQQGEGHSALKCFERMQKEGRCHPNSVTFVCILNACSISGALDEGEKIHEDIIRRGLLKNDEIILGNALVDMYAKCGMLTKAQLVLDGLPSRDVISWNALISGYAQHGQGHDALKCFEQMRSEGFVPDQVSFLCILSACSHSGLSFEAQMHFRNMMRKYGIVPNLEHHICMVMVFGCEGYFDTAISVIQAMPSSCNNPGPWLALLGACRKWGNAKLGRLAFDQVVQSR